MSSLSYEASWILTCDEQQMFVNFHQVELTLLTTGYVHITQPKTQDCT